MANKIKFDEANRKEKCSELALLPEEVTHRIVQTWRKLVSSPSLESEVGRLTEKLEKEIQAVKRHMRVKNLKMFRAKEKLRAIENQQEHQRQTLRDSLEQKLRLSQAKLNDLASRSHSRSASKEKLRQTTLLRIQFNRKNSQEESFRKSQQLSAQQKTFLLDRKLSESRSRITTFRQTQSRTINQEDSVKFNSEELLEPRKKVLPKVLKVTDREIRQRQTRKSKIQESKDIKNLHQYLQKLNNIEVKRQHRSDRLAETAKLIQKERKLEEQRYSRKKAESLGDSRPKHYTSATRQAINNKYSFSEVYAKKLEESLARKTFLQEKAMREADSIMKREAEIRAKRWQSKLLGQTIKEVQRKVNFRYMERLRP